MTALVLSGAMSLDDVVAAAAGAMLELDGPALERVAANRAVFEQIVAGGASIYGVTTGFGALVSKPVPRELQHSLQVNLLRSHAAGTGDPLPEPVVRAAVAIRLNSLLRGHSGVRPVVLERAALMLNGGYVPVVPRTGSLGASGDLAPSAHAFLPLIGEGRVVAPDGCVISGGDALSRLGVAPLELELKEGLALINGTHFMAAIGALVAARVAGLLDSADLVAATTIDALRGATAAFDPRVHALRPVAGQVTSAANIAAALAGSTRARRDGTGRLQDAYSLRCAAQVHGAAREAQAFFTGLVATELNAVTDNPLVLDNPAEVVSAGNFHGQTLALAFDTLRLALADLGSIAERRIFRLLSPSTNGALPPFLTPTAGASNGYMIAQYAAAALLSELRALAHPVSTDNVPTSDNQEDHVSMGMTAALMTWEAVPRLERILAYELLCAAQAIDCDPGVAGAVVTAAHARVRERVPVLVEDRPPADDLAALLPLIEDGSLARTLTAAPTTRAAA